MERTSERVVEFTRPFRVNTQNDPLPPGSYTIRNTEEIIEGLSFLAWRRIRTQLETITPDTGSSTRRILDVDIEDIEAALALDKKA